MFIRPCKDLEKGTLLWQHTVGSPITASAYVDENLQLVSDSSHCPDRLICVCTTSGTICLLRVNTTVAGEVGQRGKDTVQEFARLELGGDIFSSPVMTSGRIFVGSRDEYVHCIAVEAQSSVQS